jgi:hypothetical protein
MEDDFRPMNRPATRATIKRLFIRVLLFVSACSVAQAAAISNAVPDWGLGPFVKHPKPVLSPISESRFTCPVLGKEVRWEE